MKRMKKIKQTCNTCHKSTEVEALYTHAVLNYLTDEVVFEYYQCGECFRKENAAYFKVKRDE